MFYHEKYTQILQAAMAWVRSPTFELNLQKWVCLWNSKFYFLHIPQQTKNWNPLTFAWNTHYYAGIFTIFSCKQSSMALCQTYTQLRTLINLSSYGHKSTLYDHRKCTVTLYVPYKLNKWIITVHNKNWECNIIPSLEQLFQNFLRSTRQATKKTSYLPVKKYKCNTNITK